MNWSFFAILMTIPPVDLSDRSKQVSRKLLEWNVGGLGCLGGFRSSHRLQNRSSHPSISVPNLPSNKVMRVLLFDNLI